MLLVITHCSMLIALKTMRNVWSNFFKWMYPGMRVKRWLMLVPIGAFGIVVGVALLANLAVIDYVNVIGDFAIKYLGINLQQPVTRIVTSLALIVVGMAVIGAGYLLDRSK